jgi:hypothetical protein
VAGFKPLTIGLRVQCSTTVLPGHNITKINFQHLINPSASGSGRVQILYLRIMSQMLYLCCTGTQQTLQNILSTLFYLLEPGPGFKPWTLWLWVNSWTTVLPRSKPVSNDLSFLFSLASRNSSATVRSDDSGSSDAADQVWPLQVLHSCLYLQMLD